VAVPFGRDRILIAGIVACLLAAVVVARLAFVQIVSYPHFAARAEQNQQGRVLLPPRRGDILDRNGKCLAGDLRTYSVYAVPRLMKNRRATARTLARLLDLDARTLEKRFRDRPAFCWVTRQANPGIEEELERARLRGVYLTVETRRQRPGGEAVLPIVGRVNLDGRGVEAVEYQFDGMLRGRPGWATLFKDGTGKQMSLPAGRSRAPQHGRGLILTLDADMQEIVVARLRAAADSLMAKQAAAVIVDPSTGQILAMASAGPGAPGAQRNPIISDQYEPGSTFKAVVAAAILEERLAEPSTVYDGGHGARDFGGFVIHDAHPHDQLTLRDAIRLSSNVICGQLALEVGARRYYEYATAFGFGALTGVEFPGEVGGRLRPPRSWSKRSLPTLAIGQEVAVTPLQMALAYAAIANGGVLLRPQLVLAELDEKGRIERRFEPRAVRRVIAPGTSATMRDFLQSVVDSGTAKRAALPWTTVAGKTGTAQKYDPETRTYARGRYIGSFVGFLPADEPRLVCLVLVDEPRRGYYGGEVAAPIFRDIMEEIRRLRGGPLSPRPATVQVAASTLRLPQTLVPDVRLLPRERAEQRLATLGLRAVMEGKGTRVLDQFPAPGSPAERGQTVRLMAARDAAAVVPDVRGLTVRDALARLSARAMPVRVSGSGRVASQTPAPGATLPKGAVCVLVCRHEAAAPAAAARAGAPALLARAGGAAHEGR
jgi:cell division protein FtsI/penicillin-binding protein 2